MYCCEGNKANIKAKLLVIDDDEHTRMYCFFEIQ